jgi:hypothetical protein
MKMLLALMILAACGGSQPPAQQPSASAAPAPAPPASEAPPPAAKAEAAPAPALEGTLLAKVTEFRDQICACKDKPCTEHVLQAMTQWSQEMVKANPEGPKLSEEGIKKITAISEDLTKCATKMMQGSP